LALGQTGLVQIAAARDLTLVVRQLFI